MQKNSDNRIRKVLFNEVSLIIATVSLVSGMIFWVMNPQKNLEVQIIKLESRVESNQTVVAALEKIKNNDFVELKEKMDQIETRQIETIKEIAVLQELVKQRVK